MKNENKKLGLYVGIALLVGGLGFLAYKKFSANDLEVENTNFAKNENDTTTTSKWSMKNPFSSNPANQLNINQLSIKTPALATDLLNSFK